MSRSHFYILSLSKGEIIQVYPKVVHPFLMQIYCLFSLGVGMPRLFWLTCLRPFWSIVVCPKDLYFSFFFVSLSWWPPWETAAPGPSTNRKSQLSTTDRRTPTASKPLSSDFHNMFWRCSIATALRPHKTGCIEHAHAERTLLPTWVSRNYAKDWTPGFKRLWAWFGRSSNGVLK